MIGGGKLPVSRINVDVKVLPADSLKAGGLGVNLPSWKEEVKVILPMRFRGYSARY